MLEHSVFSGDLLNLVAACHMPHPDKISLTQIDAHLLAESLFADTL